MTTPARAPNRDRSFLAWIKQRKWFTVVVLSVLLATTYFGYYSAWGALFVFWGVTSTLSGQVFLLEPINRTENPVLFWIISVMWIGFGVMYVLADIYPQYWV